MGEKADFSLYRLVNLKIRSRSPKSNLVCLIMLMLNIPVNNFLVMSGQSHHFLGITSTFRGVNVSLLKDGVSTTRPPHSPNYVFVFQYYI